MKKVYLSLLFISVSITSFAQIKVYSDGTLRMAESAGNTSKHYIVQVGDTAINPYGIRYGLLSSFRENTSFWGVGMKGVAAPSHNNFYASVGVWGEAGETVYCNYGVVGHVTGSSNGAGIYGMTGTHTLPIVILEGQYAGYFNGETKDLGNFTATNVYTSSDIRLKENVSDINDGESHITLDKLMDVNVIKYNLKKEAFGYNDNDMCKNMENTTNLVHFGVSAQELQELYPNLVKEGQDGYLAVNYTELVPVLIRSIQELKQELDEMKGSGEARMPRSVSDAGDALLPSAQNVLYQNTPNPFKEQTTIRFSLADDAKDAAICIFDMTGKMLKNLPISSGETCVRVNGWELGEGMFLYTLIANGKEVDTKKMIITK